MRTSCFVSSEVHVLKLASVPSWLKEWEMNGIVSLSSNLSGSQHCNREMKRFSSTVSLFGDSDISVFLETCLASLVLEITCHALLLRSFVLLCKRSC